MEKKQELLDVLDCNGRPTGRVHVRGTGVKPGDYIGVTFICIINSEGKMLIQQRAEGKGGWGGMWDVTCGGAISEGELPQEAAMRELKEELGLKADLKGVRPSITTIFSTGFSYTFVVRMDVDLQDVILQKEEVQAARFAGKEEILKMLKEEIFVPYRRSLLEYIFDFAEQEYLF